MSFKSPLTNVFLITWVMVQFKFHSFAKCRPAHSVHTARTGTTSRALNWYRSVAYISRGHVRFQGWPFKPNISLSFYVARNIRWIILKESSLYIFLSNTMFNLSRKRPRAQQQISWHCRMLILHCGKDRLIHHSAS